LAVHLRAGDNEEMLGATVDSGAPRSLFPKEFAEISLGIDSADLIQDPTKAEGIGAEKEEDRWPTWSSRIPIFGQALRPDETSGRLVPWGPEFRLNPAFAEKNQILLGRQDFFRHFKITFEHNLVAPAFVLSYEDLRGP
jgi:hypothetical protein